MPLYEFECPTCGPFDVMRPMSRAGEPVQCPDCAAGARRVWTVPQTTSMTRAQRTVAERNETSAHAPHVCKPSCGCGSRKPKTSVDPSQVGRYDGRTRQAYTGSRPWVVEH